MVTCLGIRVYVVDGGELARRGLSSLVDAETSMEIVGRSDSAQVALAEVLALRPDVAVLEHHLPDGSGTDLCRKIRTADPSIRVLVLAGDDDPETVSSAILAGASGSVPKRIDGNSLVSGIHAVAGGHSLIGPVVATRMIEDLELRQDWLEAIAELIPQQRGIFFLIGEGMTNRQIAERLCLTEETVKDQVTVLLARLGLRHRTQAALLAGRLKGGGNSTASSPATAVVHLA